MLVDYIDQRSDRFGVEPICAVLKDAGMQIAPSTCCAARTGLPPVLLTLGACGDQAASAVA